MDQNENIEYMKAAVSNNTTIACEATRKRVRQNEPEKQKKTNESQEESTRMIRACDQKKKGQLHNTCRETYEQAQLPVNVLPKDVCHRVQ